MLSIYPTQGTDYSVWGKIDKTIFKNLIDCLINSKAVRKKFIKKLKS